MTTLIRTACLLLALAAGSAPAQTAGTFAPYTNSTATDSTTARPLAARFADEIHAKDYGVAADGTSSDDAALNAAIDACAARGTKLILPAGRILLSGAATSTLRNCHIEGVGVPAGTSGSAGSDGTMFLLISTTVKPFLAGNNWRMSGINFYWPNQTSGTATYPALLNCDVGCTSWSFDRNVVVNAYDFLVDASGAEQGGFKVTDNWLYAVHDLIRSSGQGDSINVSRNQMTPGNWYRITAYTSVGAANAGSLVNTVFHLTNSTGFAWNLIAKDNAVFGWRYGFKLDATALIGISDINMVWDGTETVVDSSAGGTWAAGNKFTGIGGGSAVNLVTTRPRGNSPAFNLGANGHFIINDYVLGTNGTFMRTAGANVILDNVTLTTTGAADDGADYYAIDYTANAGGLVISVKDSSLQGRVSDAHVFGIGSSRGIAATRMIIQNSQFVYYQTPINIASALTTSITGNWSGGTHGTVAIKISGTNGVSHTGNNWDKPPTASVSFCGTGAVVVGGMSGFFTTGSAAGTTCTFTLPWQPYGGGGGACTFQTVNGVTVGAIVSGETPVRLLTFSQAYNGGNVFYDCRGRQ
jgi:hypothetical protein